MNGVWLKLVLSPLFIFQFNDYFKQFISFCIRSYFLSTNLTFFLDNFFSLMWFVLLKKIYLILDFWTDVIFSMYMKHQIPYLAISSNNQSYFSTNESVLIACYQNGFQTFCHSPKSMSNTNNNPICETSMFLNSQLYKWKILISFSECPFLTPMQSYHGCLHSTIFPKQIFLSCLKIKALVLFSFLPLIESLFSIKRN